MIYLDNAATTMQKPACVVQSVMRALTTLGNASRGAHEGTLSSNRVIYRTRASLASFFGCPKSEQVIFTNKRIIAADMQGLSGKRKSYATLPYGKVNFFSVQTTGSIGDASDSELTLSFCNGAEVTFRVIGNTDFGKLSRMIAEYIL